MTRSRSIIRRGNNRVQTANPQTQPKLTPQEALIYAMVTAAAADRKIAQSELARMRSMVSELPAFRDLDDSWFGREAQACGKVLARPGGVERVVGLIADALTGELRETAFVLAADVTESDLVMNDAEQNFLTLLADGLSLDDLVRAALQRSARMRHKAI
ncbi:MAG: tellurite resistance TerB family protein [Hyphomicrobium sp.]